MKNWKNRELETKSLHNRARVCSHFSFFYFPILRARYSLPVTVTSRFESLKHVMKGFKDVKESYSVSNLHMTRISTAGYYAAFREGGRGEGEEGEDAARCELQSFLRIDFFPFHTGG